MSLEARPLLIHASQCQLQAGHWDRARQLFFRAMAISTTSGLTDAPDPFKAYLWCMRTGHGPKLTERNRFRGKTRDRRGQWAIHEKDMVFLAEGDWNKTTSFVRHDLKGYRDLRISLSLALHKWETGHQAACFKLLNTALQYPIGQGSPQWVVRTRWLYYKDLIRAITPILRGNTAKGPRLMTFERKLRKVRWDRRIQFYFYLGWAFDATGDQKQAIEYYERCVTPWYAPVPERTLAFVRLRAKHIDPLAVMNKRARADMPAPLRRYVATMAKGATQDENGK